VRQKNVHCGSTFATPKLRIVYAILVVALSHKCSPSVVKVVVGSMARKIVCNYAMDRELMERLETLAKREEKSRSEVVRRALGHYLDNAGV
jgi:hypothetical protein